MQFANSNVGYASGFNGILLKTTNGGENWSSIPTGSNANLYGLSVFNESILFVSGNNGLIKKTTDGGVSFTVQSAPENKIVSDIQFFSELIGYAQVGNDVYLNQDNRLYKTTDGGNTWFLAVNELIDSFFFVNENLGFISKTEENTLLKTENGGLNFLPLNYSNIFEKDIFSLDGNIVWDLGTNPALCQCTSYCIKKREIIDFSLIQYVEACHDIYFGGANFNAIRFSNETTGYLVGLEGDIYKNGTGINTPLGTGKFGKIINIKIFPNPTSSLITVSLNDSNNNNITIEITDSLGKKIFSNYYKQNNITINTEKFLKGIYFLTIINNNKSQTQKIIIN